MLPVYFVRDVPGPYPVCTPPPPPFFGTAHSKGVTGGVSVSAESKGVICTKIVQNLGCLGTAHSKGLAGALAGCLPDGHGCPLPLQKQKAAVVCRLAQNYPRRTKTQSIGGCQGKRERAGEKIRRPF